ncbi:phage tail tape measure protein [Chitinimonas lacunae]|uniref:Phage tail tape measure protein n=1 Tax=Chitinimonas lacunae TaxID=1963018 RepID=A0ABV8MYY4_9NEIS
MANSNAMVAEVLIAARTTGAQELQSLARDMDRLAERATLAGDQSAQSYAAMAAGLRAAAERSKDMAVATQALQELARVGAVTSTQVADLTSKMDRLARLDKAINEFKALTLQEQAAAEQFQRLRGELLTVQKQFDATTNPTSKLKRELAQASEATRQAHARMEQLRSQLGATGAQLQTAGVDTARLTQAQQNLKASYGELAQAAKQLTQIGDARQVLGLRAHQEVNAEIQKVKAAYDVLRSSGKLTAAELVQAGDAVKRKISELEQQTRAAMDSLGDMRGTLAGLAASAAGLTIVTNKATDFQSAMADVAKKSGASEEVLGKLGSRIKELAPDLGRGATEVANMAAAGAQLGVQVPDLETYILTAGRIANSWGVTADAAGIAVAQLSNLYKLSIQEVGVLAGAIDALGDSTAATESQILDVMTRIGGSAAQFGLAGEQAGALGAAMISLGSTSETASTAINALLSRLNTASLQGADFQAGLAQIGLTAEQMAAAVRGNPQRALNDFLGTLQKLDRQTQSEVVGRMFGAEYAPAIGKLVTGLDAYQKALGTVADKSSYATRLVDAFNSRTKTTQYQLDRASSAMEVAAINIGSVFLPMVAAAADTVGDLAIGVAELAETYPALAGLATTAVTIVGSLGALKLAFVGLQMASGNAIAALASRLTVLEPVLQGITTQAGLMKMAFAGLGSLVAGFAIGTYLHDQFEWARDAGARLVGILGEIKLAGQLIADLQLAPFTDDTMVASVERYKKAVQEHRETVRALIDDAAIVPGQTAATTQQLSDAVEQHRAKLKAAEESYSGLSESARSAMMRLDTVTRSSQINTELFAAALNDAMKAADSPAAFQSLRVILQGLVNDGKLTKDAVTDLAAELNKLEQGLSAPVDRVGELIGRLQQLGPIATESTVEARTQIEANIGAGLAKITDEELPRLAEQTRKKFGEMSGAARVVAGEALQRLGVDADRALDGISAESKRATASLKALGATGLATGVQLRESLATALERADTPRAVERLRGVVRELGTTGRLSGDQLARALEAVNRKADEVARAVSGLEDDFRALGVTSTAALRSQANEARAALARIETAYRAGKATALDYHNAAQAALEKVQQGGTTTEVAIAKAKAETAEASVKFSEFAEAAERAGKAGKKAGEDTAGAMKKAGDSVKEGGAEAEKAEEKQKKAAQAIKISWEQMGISTAAAVRKVRQEWEAADKYMSNLNYSNVVIQQEAATKRIAQGIKDQAAAVADLARKYDGLSVGLNEQIPTLEEMRWQFDLLDEADLDGLKTALDGARQRVADLKAEAQDAKQALEEMADSAQDDLDRDAGNDEAVTRRKYAKERQRVEEQRKRGAGDAEVETAARKALELLNQQEQRDLATAQAKAAERNSKAKPDLSKPGNPAPTPTAPVRTEKLVVELGGRQAEVEGAPDEIAAMRDFFKNIAQYKQVSIR